MGSDGFQLFERLTGGALGARGETYRSFLDRMFDELALDLGVLFDRRDPRSLVFPDEQCLEQVFALADRTGTLQLWAEDETIGWIYQYFNDADERKKMREQSTAPRNSRELAVRNQFFTPRYVVEFLTDNTLGRIWYEMTQGQTQLTDQCRYLVRRPNEIFLNAGRVRASCAASSRSPTESISPRRSCSSSPSTSPIVRSKTRAKSCARPGLRLHALRPLRLRPLRASSTTKPGKSEAGRIGADALHPSAWPATVCTQTTQTRTHSSATCRA